MKHNFLQKLKSSSLYVYFWLILLPQKYPKSMNAVASLFSPYSPFVSIDCVIFGFQNRNLKVLVLKFHQTEIYALPGGFIKETEDIDAAAHRILSERTGVKEVYLEQFGVFGKVNRVDSETRSKLIEALDFPETHKQFIQNRFVSIGYFSLVDVNQVMLNKDAVSESLEWFDIENLPTLMHDHQEIVEAARKSLSDDLYNHAVGKNLMPEQFTMNELQNLHEAILGTKLTRTNFQRKMLSLGFLERIEKKFTGKAHKAPFLYSFR